MVDLVLETSKKLNINKKYCKVVLDLLKDGNTVPFIARYRKEQTNALDEEQIRAISMEYEYASNLLDRKETVIKLIEEKGLLTEQLKKAILACEKVTEVEDLYRPFKEKKKTRATEAKRKGLEPLAIKLLLVQDLDIEKEATFYLNDEVLTVEAAISGVCDIISELISDKPEYRTFIKKYMFNYSNIETKLVAKNKDLDEYQVYKNYYDYHERINSISDHRILAINRAEKEKIISVKLSYEEKLIVDHIFKDFVNPESINKKILLSAIDDGVKRLIMPSVSREIRAELKEKAEDQAILVFQENLANLLLTPPLKDKNILGVDPAFRTGCKLAVVSKNSVPQDISVIYPTQKNKNEIVPESRLKAASEKVVELVKKYDIDIIAIGNGTASRQTEEFISKTITNYHLNCSYIIVSEAGASVYSASKNAIAEFPDLHVEERSAISIARRVIDPLSEFVKIDPKSIGVGEYQHDVNQSKLMDSLNFEVSKVVNKIGVNVNTSGVELLQYVSGINKTIAKNIVDYIVKNGPFTNSEELKKVSRFGPKSYTQAIGFLRIYGGTEPLDMTSIHPESYQSAKEIINILDATKYALGSKELKEAIEKTDLVELRKKVGLDKFTFKDVIDSLKSPLRDVRDDYDMPILKKGVIALEDLQVGDKLQGTVRNVIDFGAFVDCGVKVDGLVHISKISKRFIKNPSEVLKVGQVVKVTVIDIDLKRKRLALSMID